MTINFDKLTKKEKIVENEKLISLFGNLSEVFEELGKRLKSLPKDDLKALANSEFVIGRKKLLRKLKNSKFLPSVSFETIYVIIYKFGWEDLLENCKPGFEL